MMIKIAKIDHLETVGVIALCVLLVEGDELDQVVALSCRVLFCTGSSVATFAASKTHQCLTTPHAS